MLNIDLRPEYVLSIYGFPLSNTFLTSLVVILILTVVSIWFYAHANDHKHIFVNSMRIIIYELLKLTDSVTQDRQLSKKILPLIASFFIFIITANLFELVPGFLGSFYVDTGSARLSLLRSPNSDLTTTLALAIISVVAIQIFSIQALGIKGYLKRFINLTNPIQFILGFFELISEVVKVLSFSFRLFGNIFAGEVLLLVIAFLIPYIIPLPFMILEVFVGTIQAFIFSVLTLTFIQTSTIKHLDRNNSEEVVAT